MFLDGDRLVVANAPIARFKLGITGGGAQGPQGNQGSQGNQGPSGSGSGPQGNQGDQGPQGLQGNQGDSGSQGNQGFQGVASTVQGPQGNQGNQGTQGLTGIGNQGNQGFQGQASNVQGPQGNQGSQGLTGSGAQGNQGNQGAAGSAGAQGNQGFQGTSGTSPVTTTEIPSSVSVTTGTLNSGALSDIQTFNDGNVYSVQETATTPGFDIRIDFSGVSVFNRVEVNLAYTNSSLHVVDVDLWNFVTSGWDTIGVFHGLAGYTQLVLGVIDSAPYISAGVVNSRLYHVSAGTGAHSIQIDYLALQNALQGPQGAGGSQGSQGNQGNQGFQGFQGNQGSQGNQGFQGQASTVPGNQGNQGNQGTQGNQGNQGFQGNQGNQGSQGLTGIGNQGNQGNQGFQGNQGNQGNQGLTGTGSQGNQGNQGSQGNQGNAQVYSVQGNQVDLGVQTVTNIFTPISVAAGATYEYFGIIALQPSLGVQGVQVGIQCSVGGATVAGKVIGPQTAGGPDSSYYQTTQGVGTIPTQRTAGAQCVEIAGIIICPAGSNTVGVQAKGVQASQRWFAKPNSYLVLTKTS